MHICSNTVNDLNVSPAAFGNVWWSPLALVVQMYCTIQWIAQYIFLTVICWIVILSIGYGYPLIEQLGPDVFKI